MSGETKAQTHTLIDLKRSNQFFVPPPPPISFVADLIGVLN